MLVSCTRSLVEVRGEGGEQDLTKSTAQLAKPRFAQATASLSGVPTFVGNIDTDEALRASLDATSPDGSVILIAVSGQEHMVTALNIILQVRGTTQRNSTNCRVSFIQSF